MYYLLSIMYMLSIDYSLRGQARRPAGAAKGQPRDFTNRRGLLIQDLYANLCFSEFGLSGICFAFINFRRPRDFTNRRG